MNDLCEYCQEAFLKTYKVSEKGQLFNTINIYEHGSYICPDSKIRSKYATSTHHSGWFDSVTKAWKKKNGYK